VSHNAWVAYFSANTGGNVASGTAGINGNLYYNSGATFTFGAGSTNQGYSTGIYYDYLSGRLWGMIAYGPGSVFHLYEMYALQGAQSAILSQSPGHFSGNLATIAIGGTNLGTTYSTGAGSTASLWYGSLGEEARVNNKGELYVIPWKGMHLMSTRKNAAVDQRTVTGQVITVFLKLIDGYNTTLPGQIVGAPTTTGITGYATTTRSVLDNPYSGAPMTTTNGVGLLSVFTEPAAQAPNNRLLMISGMYTGSNNYGLPMSRLLLKG